jgi:hypothetical protein
VDILSSSHQINSNHSSSISISISIFKLIANFKEEFPQPIIESMPPNKNSFDLLLLNFLTLSFFKLSKYYSPKYLCFIVDILSSSHQINSFLFDFDFNFQIDCQFQRGISSTNI